METKISGQNSNHLDEIAESLRKAVDYIVITGTQNTYEGNWIVAFDELSAKTGFNPATGSVEMLLDMVAKQAAVSDVALASGGIDVCYFLDYCPNCQKEA